jgi:hypothetical protein
MNALGIAVFSYPESFAQPMKNGSQAVNERFFDFPEISLSC